MKKVVRLTEGELKNMVSESVKRVLNEGKDRSIRIELPEDVADNEEVMNVIRKAMHEIGYEYYNNESGGYENGTWVYRYAPHSAPVEMDVNDADRILSVYRR